MTPTPEEMRNELLRMARDLLDQLDEHGGHGETMDDLIAAAERGDELAAAVIAYCSPQMIVTQPTLADHIHSWKKVSEELTGMTQTRTYECPVCNSHTTLIGPYGASSPFDVEEVTHDRSIQD